MIIEKTLQTILDDIKKIVIPKLKRGLKSGRVELTAEDCDRLLIVLSTSVSLEPFLDLFSKLMQSTVAEYDEIKTFKKSNGTNRN
jgi:hypothetical protein